MELFELMEPYITGITSILGIFFIQAVWLTMAKLLAGNRFSEKKISYMMELGSGVLMTLASIYLTFMSATDHYYYLYGNLRLVIILIPAIFISVRVSMFSIFFATVFRFLNFGITSVSISYAVLFTIFLIMVIIAKKLTRKNNLRTLIASFIGAMPLWLIIYAGNFDGMHVYTLDYMVKDYLNFITISGIAFLSSTYLERLNALFFKTVTDSLIDELTKVRNLKDFNQTYLRAFEEAKTKGKSLNLALFDIDHFKAVNDTYGHLAGNYVLVELTNVLKQMEELDYGKILFRTGGEEFALLFREKTAEESYEILEKVRKNVEKHFFSYEGQQIKITISIGLATHQVNDESLDELYSRADEALYRSKKLGRNMVSK